jgi:hypothetical protein
MRWNRFYKYSHNEIARGALDEGHRAVKEGITTD